MEHRRCLRKRDRGDRWHVVPPLRYRIWAASGVDNAGAGRLQPVGILKRLTCPAVDLTPNTCYLSRPLVLAERIQIFQFCVSSLRFYRVTVAMPSVRSTRECFRCLVDGMDP
jgi:hypothetical protein